MMRVLPDLLILLEKDDENITSGVVAVADTVKKAWSASKERHKKSISDKHDAEREAKKKHDEAEKAAKQAVDADNKAQEKAKKEAEHAAKAAAEDHKLKSAKAIEALRGDIDSFIKNFFEKFPYHGGEGGAEDVLQKYQTREAALVAFKAFKGIAERLDQLLDGFNSALVAQKKVTRKQVDQYTKQAKRLLQGDNPNIPAQLTRFVKKEAGFFKRLVKVNDDFKLAEDDFKELLTLKINHTSNERVPDAAQALNLLFTYMIDEFRGHARIIASAGRTMDDEAATTRKASEPQVTEEP